MMSSSVKKGFACLFNRILFTSRLVHTFSYKFGPPPILPQRRVVVTGLGLVTPLGCGVETSWENVVGGKCGIRALTFEDIAMEGFKEEAMKSAYDHLSSKVVASVPCGASPGEFDSDRWLDLKNQRYMARFISYALCATEEALIDSNWLVEDSEEKENTGVAIGGGIGSIRDILEATNLISEQSLRRLSPFFIPRILINMAAGHVSMKYGFKGPNHAAVTACATGAHSIGDAFKMVRFGDADVMVAGGTESSIDALSIAGFCRAKALSTKFNASPEKSSRPFDRSRDGFVIGEGAGTMVLEELEHAKKRNAKIYAEVRGYGMSGDAYHITKPSDDGHGALLAMSRALKQAGLSPSQVDYINAHATSTPIGDSVEAKAIKSLFGDHSLSGKLAISSTKGATGHLLGAAGAVEAIFAVLALYHDIAPLTLNLEHADPVFHDGFMPLNCSKKMAIHAALTNSFGFGGTNASLAFTKFSGDDGYQA